MSIQTLMEVVLFRALKRVIQQVEECEEINNVAVLYGKDMDLLDFVRQPCSSCDPAFSCWDGGEPCRKAVLRLSKVKKP